MVDRFLVEVANHVDITLDSAVSLLKLLPILSILPDKILLNELISTKDDNRLAIAVLMSKLWKFEQKLDDLNSKTQQSEEHYHGIVKTKEQIVDATNATANALLVSSESIKKLVAKRSKKIEPENNRIKDIVGALCEHLRLLKHAGHENISTTAEIEKNLIVKLQKLRERCEVLRERKGQLTLQVKERENNHNRETTSLAETLDHLKKELAQTKEMENDKQAELSNYYIREVEKETVIHKIRVTSLKGELSSLQERLKHAKETNVTEKSLIMARKVKLESDLTRDTTRYNSAQKEQKNLIESLEGKIKKETMKRMELEHYFALIDQNEEIRRKEDEIFQKRINLEVRVEEILFYGVTQLQRLYRGMRDRRLVVKKKKKKKKKNRKSKQGKGKKG